MRYALLAALVCACGHAHVRGKQDWNGVTDARLYRTCHVTNYGSGVAIARTDDALYVLACAHVAGKRGKADVWFPPEYRSLHGEIVASSSFKEDLSLIAIRPPPPGKNYKLKLARDFKEGERRPAVDLMVITSEGRPLIYTAPIVERSVLWGTNEPDETGATTYTRLSACVYGPAKGANSGSPVFEGDALVGLNEISPFDAEIDGKKVTGLGISIPRRIRGFLVRHGYAGLIEQDG